MYNSKNATVSKNLFFVSCSLALIFLLAFFWCLANGNDGPGGGSLLDKAAADPETRFVAVIKEDSTVDVLRPDGSLAEKCGDVNSAAKVVGKCNINGTFVNISTLTIFTTESSPGCTHVYNSAGYFLFRKCS